MAGAAAEPGGTDRARQLQRSCGNRGLVAGRPKPISTHGTMTMRDHQRERGPQPQQNVGRTLIKAGKYMRNGGRFLWADRRTRVTARALWAQRNGFFYSLRFALGIRKMIVNLSPRQ